MITKICFKEWESKEWIRVFELESYGIIPNINDKVRLESLTNDTPSMLYSVMEIVHSYNTNEDDDSVSIHYINIFLRKIYGGE